MTTSKTRLASHRSALAILALGAIFPSLAQAHFVQQDPPSYAEQDNYGSPQKSVPCGQADPGNAAVATNKVTTYTQGQTINVTINETIMHPGHYRVSIADDMSKLPADPAVVADGNSACGSTTITANPTLPLVADGLLMHTAAFNGPQTVQVKLPAGLTCTKCTMQIAEFMSNHPLNNPGGCFYHHCATISIVPPGSNPTDGGVADSSTATPDGSTTTNPPVSGCGYYLGAAATPAALSLAGPFVLGLLLRRRRRATAAA